MRFLRFYYKFCFLSLQHVWFWPPQKNYWMRLKTPIIHIFYMWKRLIEEARAHSCVVALCEKDWGISQSFPDLQIQEHSTVLPPEEAKIVFNIIGGSNIRESEPPKKVFFAHCKSWEFILYIALKYKSHYYVWYILQEFMNCAFWINF